MITMNAAIADKKVQRSLLIWKPLSNDRSDHMETERTLDFQSSNL